MNDYDDSEDYSSANSFRARSNTWPLNRPDLAVPNSVCIDETLPEIELEEDDLFTTNENWSTSLVDHDIMSWDPILNAQNQHHQHNHQHHHQQQNNQQAQPHNQPQQATTVHHHHHPHQTHPRQLPIHHNQQQSQQHPHQLHEQNLISGSTIILDGGQVQQQPQQLPPQHHQTLNNQHCLADPDEYHLQQLHHLRLDNNPQAQTDHQAHYIPPLSSTLCIQGPASLGLCNDSYNVSSDHQQQQQHHHLQPLTPARYDLDQQNDLELNTANVHHHINHQLHPLTSTTSLEHQSTSHMLSSSLATSGIGLSGDLEDLDYKAVDPSLILQNSPYDEQQADQQPQGDGIGGKSSGSATSSKTKLNTPRKNAWGNMSYADLISQAINSTNDKRLTLSQIYDWMVQHVPYFKDKGDSNSSAGWKNSVRHNLSLHNRFKRLQNEGTGKSSWWTINPEANVGKCARRRAASMEASKYEKKRGRAKKRAEAIRQGLVSYPSLTNSSLNGSSGNLEPQTNLNPTSAQFGPQPQQQAQPTQQTQTQTQQQPQQLPNTDGRSSDNLHNDNGHPNTGLYLASSQNSQYEQIDNKLQQQQERYFYFNHHQIEPSKHNIDYVL